MHTFIILYARARLPVIQIAMFSSFDHARRISIFVEYMNMHETN